MALEGGAPRSLWRPQGRRPAYSDPSVVQDDIQEGAVNLQASVVVDEA
jgi:hypothetical protein